MQQGIILKAALVSRNSQFNLLLENALYTSEENQYKENLLNMSVNSDQSNNASLNIEPSADLPSKEEVKDLTKVKVNDPNLYAYSELMTKFTPKDLLEKYETTLKKGKVSVARSINSQNDHE